MMSISSAFRVSCSLNPSRNILNIYRQNAPLVVCCREMGVVRTLEEKIGLPPKPKKPLTPYFRYMKEMRPVVSSENPKANIMEVVKLIATKWETVDQNMKKKLQQEFKNEQISYVERRAKYDSQLTDEQRSEIKQLKLNIVEAKERRAMKKRIRELGRPRKPGSAFIKFVADERTITPQTPNQSYREWHQKITEKWGRFTDTEKENYVQDARKELEKYKKAMIKWEEKMIRLGHIDVVRQDSLIDPNELKLKQKLTPSKTKNLE